MNIFIVKTPLLGSNMYVIEEEKHIVIIDPYWNAEVSALLQNLGAQIDFVYLTHEHYDHVSGVPAYQEMYHTCVFCSNACANGLLDSKKNHTHYFDAFFALQSKCQSKSDWNVRPAQYHANAMFEGRHEMGWQGHNLVFFETPGHSEGSSCLLFDNKLLFCGDSLTQNADAITRFPGGDVRAFQDITVPLFVSLPQDVVAFPGHGASFCIGQLKWDR